MSVVIVTHGGGHLLSRCLQALRERTRERYEVIVLDSASPDGIGEWARQSLRGIKVHTSSKNLGFGAMSNAGVLDSQAPYVCFLNADVTVERNWLPPLLEVLETQPHVGAVAPLVLNPDRSVQEYGSVVGADGWTTAWTGAELGEQAGFFRRPVDYASAACLLVRRRAFHDVGGFAPEYHIAYFEDADLAFAMRELNWATMVEPRSVVVHERHGMSGSERATQLMRHNHGTFASKWSRRLADRVTLAGGIGRTADLAHARDLTAVERVLVIDDRVPNADRGSGDPRTQRLIEALLARDRLVTFLARDSSRAQDYARWLLERGVEVAWNVADIASWMSHRKGCFDVAIVSRPHNWEWAAAAVDSFQPQAIRIYDAESLFHRRLGQVAKVEPHREHLQLEAERVRELEANAFTWADVGMCITQEELDWVVNSVIPNTVMHVVSYSAEPAASIPGFRERSGIAFFGGFMAGPGSPNEHSVLELASEVWPVLRKDHPDLRLAIVGSDPTAAVHALAGDAVDVIGRVPDPSWWLSRALLHLAPMRFGAGLKLKFVESMAAGLPFLTTTLGAEGLHLGELTAHLVSDSPAEMASQADRLLSDRWLWTDVQEQLLDIVQQHFATEVFQRCVDDVLLSCGLAPAQR